MYRLLIADDEDEERKGIRFLLNKCGFMFDIAEAVDGRDALEKLGDFPADILLTDVKMPFMDGIELATRARELIPGLQLIFFSGYDDFDFVRRALSLQAVDYILKPVSPSDFEKVISLVVGRLKKEEAADTNSRQFHKNYVLSRLLNKVPIHKLKQEYEIEKLQFAGDYSRLVLMEFEDDFFGKCVTDIRQFVQQFQVIISGAFDFLDVNPSQGAFFLKNGYGEGALARELARCIHLLVKKEYHKSCYLSVSPIIGGPDEIGSAYETAEASLEDRFFYKDVFVYPVDERVCQENISASSEGEILQTIEKDISCRDCFSLKKDVENILDKCRVNGFQSYIYTRFVCANLIQTLCKGMPDGEERVAGIVEKSYGCASFAELENLIRGVVEGLEKRLNLEQDSPKRTIAIVEQYIREHYEEVLSLDILADKVYLTPHYLSSMFIQEKEIGINKYIKNVRMEKAVELLTETNMKISDICEKVGYTNLSYFCRSFRNEYGMTPEQYRR